MPWVPRLDRDAQVPFGAMLLAFGAAAGAVVTLAIESSGSIFRAPPPPAPVSAPAAAPAPSRGPAEVRPPSPAPAGKPGPWGFVQATDLVFEAPASRMAEAPCDGTVQPWRLAGVTRTALPAFLRDVGVPEALASELLARATCEARGCTVEPTYDLVFALPREARNRLYPVLGAQPGNPAYTEPYRVPRRDFEPWLASSGLSPAEADLVRALTWRSGDSVAFSDLGTACARISPASRPRLVRALGFNRSVLLSVTVPEGADVDGLAAYWGTGREGEVRPMLEALATRPGGGTIDVSYLLPPFARSRLYTFPPAGSTLNCHWTSMNFGAGTPDDTLLGEAGVAAALQQRYRPLATGEGPRFGDLVMMDEDGLGRPVHSVVYIADDVVFTKNGRHSLRPWVLMRLGDLLETYFADRAIPIRYYRPKGA